MSFTSTPSLATTQKGEAHLWDGTGSQLETGNRWGDYSDLTIDPVDDRTFYYTNEYCDTTDTFNWRTRIAASGSKFVSRSKVDPKDLEVVMEHLR